MGASNDKITHKENNGKLSLQSYPYSLDGLTPKLGKGKNKLRIYCIADTHQHHKYIDNNPYGIDMFIFAGDLTNYQTSNDENLNSFLQWVKSFRSKYKIIVAGNHDFCLSKKTKEEKDAIFNRPEYQDIIYLENSGITFPDLNINFFGFPHTVRRNVFYRGCAFEISGDKFNEICNQRFKSKIDILITHSPPYDIMDVDYRKWHHGSTCLLNDLILRERPKVHIFGHNHDVNGMMLGKVDGDEIMFINCSQSPIIFDYLYD